MNIINLKNMQTFNADQFSSRVLTVMIAGAVNDPSERNFLFLLVPLESRTKGSVNKVAVR